MGLYCAPEFHAVNHWSSNDGLVCLEGYKTDYMSHTYTLLASYAPPLKVNDV